MRCRASSAYWDAPWARFSRWNAAGCVSALAGARDLELQSACRGRYITIATLATAREPSCLFSSLTKHLRLINRDRSPASQRSTRIRSDTRWFTRYGPMAVEGEQSLTKRGTFKIHRRGLPSFVARRGGPCLTELRFLFHISYSIVALCNIVHRSINFKHLCVRPATEGATVVH